MAAFLPHAIAQKKPIRRGELISAPIQQTNSATPAVAANSATNQPKANPGKPGYTELGFDLLASYEFEVPDDLLMPPTNKVAEASAQTAAKIPPNIKALDSKTVGLKGFMLPLKVEGGLVTELLIMRDQSMCCYGTVPKINEWVSVKMGQKGVKPVMDQPVTLYGKLKVGEMRENGYLVGIYQLDGESMTTPE